MEYPEVALVNHIVRELLSTGSPEDQEPQIDINRTIDEKGVLLTLTLNVEDAGRIIGKGGSTAQAIRSLLRSLGMRRNARYNLKIVTTD